MLVSERDSLVYHSGMQSPGGQTRATERTPGILEEYPAGVIPNCTLHPGYEFCRNSLFLI